MTHLPQEVWSSSACSTELLKTLAEQATSVEASWRCDIQIGRKSEATFWRWKLQSTVESESICFLKNESTKYCACTYCARTSICRLRCEQSSFRLAQLLNFSIANILYYATSNIWLRVKLQYPSEYPKKPWKNYNRVITIPKSIKQRSVWSLLIHYNISYPTYNVYIPKNPIQSAWF